MLQIHTRKQHICIIHAIFIMRNLIQTCIIFFYFSQPYLQQPIHNNINNNNTIIRHSILRSDMSFNDIMIICMMEVYKNSSDEDIKHLQWNDFFDNYLNGYTQHVGMSDDGKYGFMNNAGDTIFYTLPNTILNCLPQFTGFWHGVPYG